MLSKLKFCKRVMLWTGVITMLIIAIIGLCFGKVVEATLFEEIAKWFLVGLGVTGIMEVFAYILSPFVWHMLYDGKREYDPDET